MAGKPLPHLISYTTDNGYAVHSREMEIYPIRTTDALAVVKRQLEELEGKPVEIIPPVTPYGNDF